MLDGLGLFFLPHYSVGLKCVGETGWLIRSSAFVFGVNGVCSSARSYTPLRALASARSRSQSDDTGGIQRGVEGETSTKHLRADKKLRIPHPLAHTQTLASRCMHECMHACMHACTHTHTHTHTILQGLKNSLYLTMVMMTMQSDLSLTLLWHIS